MSTLALILVIGEATVAVAAILIAWHFAAELDRLKGGQPARDRLRAAEDRLTTLLRSAPPFQHHSGRHQSRPATVPSPQLASEQVTGHADAMWQASEEYLPPLPAGEHPYVTPQEWQSYVNAGRAVEPVRTGEHPPWTGSQPALTPEVEAAELDRQRYIRARLDECGAIPTMDDLREILGTLRQPSVTESVSAWRTDAAPVYGEAPVAGVLEAERQDAGLLT
jgi:hypothetical protein